MLIATNKSRDNLWYRVLSLLVVFAFSFSLITLPPVSAQTVLNLPTPGTIVSISPIYNPVMVNGITIHPTDPLKFDFLIDTGDSGLEGEDLSSEAMNLIKYFLASLTTPEEELWVNLSPYEKDRIISEEFGLTDMGRDLLAQDYMLKQLTASLMNPDDDLGQKFWNKVYERAQQLYGTTEIPINTFNKVWIVPDKAIIYEHENNAFILDSHLKVMLEEDFIALESTLKNEKLGMVTNDTEVISGASSEVLKEVLIPVIEKEVNEGQTFAQLRQIYHGIILASWYKQALKESLLGQVYADQKKTLGLEMSDKDANQKIYNQYLEAFKKGVHDIIREDYDPVAQEMIPRKYFSGGFSAASTVAATQRSTSADPSSLNNFRADRRLTIALSGGVRGSADASVLTKAQYPTTHARARKVEAERNRIRFEEGLFRDHAQTPWDIASIMAPIENDLNVTKHVGQRYTFDKRQEFRTGRTTGTFGQTNQVEIEALARSGKIFNSKLTDQDLLEILGLGADKAEVNRLRADLKKAGYLDDEDKITDAFNELDPENMALDGTYGVHLMEVYLGILNVSWHRVKAVYQGGWAEIMKYFGASDQAREPMTYLSKQPQEMSTLLIRHARHQEAAIAKMRMTEEEEIIWRASRKYVDLYIPILMDVDHGHGKPQQLIQVNLSVGGDGLLVASVHIEDQCKKKCGHMPRKSLVTTKDWIQIITAIRQQLDAMGLFDVTITHRTDGEDAHIIAGIDDGRDQEHLLGLTNYLNETTLVQARVDAEKEIREEVDNFVQSGDIAPEDVEKTVAEGMETSNGIIDSMIDDNGMLKPYSEVIVHARTVLNLPEIQLQTVDAVWKKLSGRKRLDKLIEETLVSQGDDAKMSVAEWHAFLQTIPRKYETDYIGIVKAKARELGIVVHSKERWDGFLEEAPELFNDGRTHLLWDSRATYIHEDGNDFYMIESGLPMAISRNAYGLAYADSPWMEQKKAFILEIIIWAMALDQAAVDLLVEKNYWDLLDQFGDDFKKQNGEEIEQILRNYLIQRNFNPETSFVDTRESLVALGLHSEVAIHLINSVSRFKSNNTSPSFPWAFQEIGITSEKLQSIIDDILKFLPSFKYVATTVEEVKELWNKAHETHGLKAEPVVDVKRQMTDDERKNFVTVQGRYSQMQFSTYFGEVKNHVLSQLFLEGIEGQEAEDKLREILLDIFEKGYLTDEMHVISRLQELGYGIKNYFTENTQVFAGVVYDTVREAGGKGEKVLFQAYGGKSDTQGKSIAQRLIDQQLAQTAHEISNLQSQYAEAKTVEDLRQLQIEIHVKLKAVRQRIAEAGDDTKTREALVRQEVEFGNLARSAVQKLMPLEGSDQITFSLDDADLTRIESRFGDPEGYYDDLYAGLREDLFVLGAALRGVLKGDEASRSKETENRIRRLLSIPTRSERMRPIIHDLLSDKIADDNGNVTVSLDDIDTIGYGVYTPGQFIRDAFSLGAAEPVNLEEGQAGIGINISNLSKEQVFDTTETREQRSKRNAQIASDIARTARDLEISEEEAARQRVDVILYTAGNEQGGQRIIYAPDRLQAELESISPVGEDWVTVVDEQVRVYPRIELGSIYKARENLPDTDASALTRGEVQDKVLALVNRSFAVQIAKLKEKSPGQEITLDTKIKEDLGIKSIEVVDFILDLEEEFSISIPDEVGFGVQTIGAFFDLVWTKVQQKPSDASSLTQADVERDIIDVISADWGFEPAEIQTDTRLDYLMDSLDVVELLMTLEPKFKVSVPDEDIGRLTTIGNLASYIIEKAKKDASTLTDVEPVGGIDFNPVNLNMLIQRDGKGVPIPVSQQPILNIKIDGLLPTIINVAPIINVRLLLGLADENETDTLDYSGEQIKTRELDEVSYLN